MMCFRKILVAKKFMDRTGGGGGSIKIFFRKFFVSQFRKILQCFINFGYLKKLGISSGRGIKIFRQKFFVPQCRKTSQGNPSVVSFRNFPVTKKLMVTTGVGEYQDFPSKVFLYHSAAKLRSGTNLCCVSENFLSLKSLWLRGGGVSRFSVEIVLSHIAEKFHRGTLQYVTYSRYRKILRFRGLCYDFLYFFLSPSAENFGRGSLL